jgi:hypothetical protein
MSVAREMVPVLIRKYAWDIIPHEHTLSFLPVLGLIPASAEGVSVEHHDTHRRISLQSPIQNLISVHAVLAARATAAFALRLDLNTETDPKIVQMVTTQFAETIHIGATAIIAHFLEEGYLQLGPKAAQVPAVVSQ